ncbi:MAG: hypothetical protein JXA99_11860, partial [Candidatus Lokiarchaeota archaeon]|nr:hypothetical protein [Candidatus Lokiarchaeota archaeon]
LDKCSLIVGTETSNKVLINFCESQTDSSTTRTSILFSFACSVKIKNSTVLLRILAYVSSLIKSSINLYRESYMNFEIKKSRELIPRTY